MLPLIEASELKLLNKDSYVLIDARGFGNSRERYEQGHLEGALYVDLEELAVHPEDPAFGGRHPLPTLHDFTKFLGRLGITPQSHVIVYDDKGAANPAARFWWMLKAIGPQIVQVLNGGLQAAINSGLPVTTAIPTMPETTNYEAAHDFTGMAVLKEVAEAAQRPERVVIDVREAPRYLGHTEPLDLVAGHIPGAINVPYNTNMNGDNQYLPAEELKANYEKVFNGKQPEQVIVHCGSGVTACHTLLSLQQAGLPGAKLYVGSWSEWSRRDLPIAKEEV